MCEAQRVARQVLLQVPMLILNSRKLLLMEILLSHWCGYH